VRGVGSGFGSNFSSLAIDEEEMVVAMTAHLGITTRSNCMRDGMMVLMEM
jgi:hypothetical protein